MHSDAFDDRGEIPLKAGLVQRGGKWKLTLRMPAWLADLLKDLGPYVEGVGFMKGSLSRDLSLAFGPKPLPAAAPDPSTSPRSIGYVDRLEVTGSGSWRVLLNGHETPPSTGPGMRVEVRPYGATEIVWETAYEEARKAAKCPEGTPLAEHCESLVRAHAGVTEQLRAANKDSADLRSEVTALQERIRKGPEITTVCNACGHGLPITGSKRDGAVKVTLRLGPCPKCTPREATVTFRDNLVTVQSPHPEAGRLVGKGMLWYEPVRLPLVNFPARQYDADRIRDELVLAGFDVYPPKGAAPEPDRRDSLDYATGAHLNLLLAGVGKHRSDLPHRAGSPLATDEEVRAYLRATRPEIAAPTRGASSAEGAGGGEREAREPALPACLNCSRPFSEHPRTVDLLVAKYRCPAGHSYYINPLALPRCGT